MGKVDQRGRENKRLIGWVCCLYFMKIIFEYETERFVMQIRYRFPSLLSITASLGGCWGQGRTVPELVVWWELDMNYTYNSVLHFFS